MLLYMIKRPNSKIKISLVTWFKILIIFELVNWTFEDKQISVLNATFIP